MFSLQLKVWEKRLKGKNISCVITSTIETAGTLSLLTSWITYPRKIVKGKLLLILILQNHKYSNGFWVTHKTEINQTYKKCEDMLQNHFCFLKWHTFSLHVLCYGIIFKIMASLLIMLLQTTSTAKCNLHFFHQESLPFGLSYKLKIELFVSMARHMHA